MRMPSEHEILGGFAPDFKADYKKRGRNRTTDCLICE